MPSNDFADNKKKTYVLIINNFENRKEQNYLLFIL